LNIPVNEIQARAKELGGPETPIVLYCASGARSGYAARLLASAGFKKVVNAGGLYDMPGF
jgi:rhodanese-related sulfurtransferase